ncbi:hypothetical protein ACLKA6_000443 [Drosophila palustris]
MDKINELIEAQMILGNELEQLYRVAAAEASSMDSLQLRRLKDDFTHHKKLFIQQRKRLLFSMEINKVKRESLPYFEEEDYEDKFISLIADTSMILSRISLKETANEITAANEIKRQKVTTTVKPWYDFRFGDDQDDSLSLFASKTQPKAVTQKVTAYKPWYDFTFGDNRDQENKPKSKAEYNLKTKYCLEKDTFGINYSFPPAKKQWEGAKERKNMLPKQREQDLEKKQQEMEKKLQNLEEQLKLEKLQNIEKQLNLEKQQQETEKRLQNLEKQLELEKQQNLDMQLKLEKRQNLERQLNLEKQQE